MWLPDLGDSAYMYIDHNNFFETNTDNYLILKT